MSPGLNVSFVRFRDSLHGAYFLLGDDNSEPRELPRLLGYETKMDKMSQRDRAPEQEGEVKEEESSDAVI